MLIPCLRLVGAGQYTFAIRSVDQRELNTIAATMSRQFPWQLKGMPDFRSPWSVPCNKWARRDKCHYRGSMCMGRFNPSDNYFRPSLFASNNRRKRT